MRVTVEMGNLLDIKLVLLTLAECGEARQAVEAVMGAAGFSEDTIDGALATVEEMVQEAEKAEDKAREAWKPMDAYALASE